MLLRRVPHIRGGSPLLLGFRILCHMLKSMWAGKFLRPVWRIDYDDVVVSGLLQGGNNCDFVPQKYPAPPNPHLCLIHGAVFPEARVLVYLGGTAILHLQDLRQGGQEISAI